MAEVYANANQAAAQHVETKRALSLENRKVEVKAMVNLAQANSTTRITPKGYFPAEIETAEGDVDYYTILHAPNAMALEFGHAPSGWFEGTNTKPPAAEYILTKAADGGGVIE
jgi:hypothetical protein